MTRRLLVFAALIGNHFGIQQFFADPGWTGLNVEVAVLLLVVENGFAFIFGFNLVLADEVIVVAV